MRFRSTTLMASVLIFLLLASAACDLGIEERPPSSEVTVQAGELTKLTAGDDVTVTLPVGAVPAGSKVHAETAPLTDYTPPAGVTVLSDRIVVDVGGSGKLERPARITFAVPDGFRAGSRPVVLWQNEAGDLDPLKTRWDKESGTVSARSSHFSWGILVSIDG